MKVVKKDGTRLAFDRNKIKSGIEKACWKRSVRDDQIEGVITLVENDLGFSLYRSVTAAKVALSTQEAVDFDFSGDGVNIKSTIARADFEDWIGPDLARIAGAVDQVLATAKTAPAEIEKVFLTGGTSFVPAVRQLFVERFGDDKLMSADQFESIAYGLALIGQSDDPRQWAIAA